MQAVGQWDSFGNRDWLSPVANNNRDKNDRARFANRRGVGNGESSGSSNILNGVAPAPERLNRGSSTAEIAYRASAGANAALLANSVANPFGGALQLPIARSLVELQDGEEVNFKHIRDVVVKSVGLETMAASPCVSDPSELTEIHSMADEHMVFRVLNEKYPEKDAYSKKLLILAAVTDKLEFKRLHSCLETDLIYARHCLLSKIRGYERCAMKSYLVELFLPYVSSERLVTPPNPPKIKVTAVELEAAVAIISKWNTDELAKFVLANCLYPFSNYPIYRVGWALIVALLIGKRRGVYIDYCCIADRVKRLVGVDGFAGLALYTENLAVVSQYSSDSEFASYLQRVEKMSKDSKDKGARLFSWDADASEEFTLFIRTHPGLCQVQGFPGICIISCDKLFDLGYSPSQVTNKYKSVVESERKRRYKSAYDTLVAKEKPPSIEALEDRIEALNLYRENKANVSEGSRLLCQIHSSDLFIQSIEETEARVGPQAAINGFADVLNPNLRALRVVNGDAYSDELERIGRLEMLAPDPLDPPAAVAGDNNPPPIAVPAQPAAVPNVLAAAEPGSAFTGRFHPHAVNQRYNNNTLTWLNPHHGPPLLANTAEHLLVQQTLLGRGNSVLLVDNNDYNANGDFAAEMIQPTALRVWVVGNIRNLGIRKGNFLSLQDTRCPLCTFRLINLTRINEVIPVCHVIPRVRTSRVNRDNQTRRMVCHYACFFSGLSQYPFVRSMAVRCLGGEYSWGISRNFYDTNSDPAAMAAENPRELLWSYIECCDLVVGCKIIAGRRNETFAQTANWVDGDPVWVAVRGVCPILRCTSKSLRDMFNHWVLIGEWRNQYFSLGNLFD
jgi:hypothetical protein